MKKIIKKIITENTERYDDIIEIHVPNSDIDNIEIYGPADEEYFADLCRQIEEDGLINPPVIYPKTFEIKSGHTRIAALKALGYSEVPIIWSTVEKQKNRFKNIMRLMTENMGRPSNLERQWNSVQEAIREYKSQHGACPLDVIKQICSAAQLSYKYSYTNLKKLSDPVYEDGWDRPELVTRIFSNGGNNLSISRAVSFAKADASSAAKHGRYQHSSKVLVNAIDNSDVVYAINRVSNNMTYFRDATFTDLNGETKYAFRNIQQNIVGGLVHELVTNAFADSINNKRKSNSKVIAYNPKDNGIYDISFPAYNAGIEVKTCLIKNGSKIEFISRTPKTGYFVFVAYTPEYDYFYVSYGKVDESNFGNKSRFGTKISLEAISKLPALTGELKLDLQNGKYICFPHQLTF